MSAASFFRTVIIIVGLFYIVFGYLNRKKWLSETRVVYWSLWYMLLILELCILQMIVSEGSFFKYVFSFLFLISFLAFWDLLGEFISIDKKQLLKSSWFYITTFGILFLMLLELRRFYLYDILMRR